MKRKFAACGYEVDRDSLERVDVQLDVGDHGYRLDTGASMSTKMRIVRSAWDQFINFQRRYQLYVIYLTSNGLDSIEDVIIPQPGFFVVGYAPSEEDEDRLITTVVLAKVKQRLRSQKPKPSHVLLRTSQGYIYDLTMTSVNKVSVKIRRRISLDHRLISGTNTDTDAPAAIVQKRSQWRLEINGALSFLLSLPKGASVDDTIFDNGGELVVYNCTGHPASSVDSFRSEGGLKIVGYAYLDKKNGPAYVVCAVAATGGTIRYNTTDGQTIRITRKHGSDKVVVRAFRH